jgi:hypothetical protein
MQKMKKLKNKRLKINFDFYLNDFQKSDNNYLSNITKYANMKCLNCFKTLIVLDFSKVENQLCKSCQNCKLTTNQLKNGLRQISNYYAQQTKQFLDNL